MEAVKSKSVFSFKYCLPLAAITIIAIGVDVRSNECILVDLILNLMFMTTRYVTTQRDVCRQIRVQVNHAQFIVFSQTLFYLLCCDCGA